MQNLLSVIASISICTTDANNYHEYKFGGNNWSKTKILLGGLYFSPFVKAIRFINSVCTIFSLRKQGMYILFTKPFQASQSRYKLSV